MIRRYLFYGFLGTLIIVLGIWLIVWLQDRGKGTLSVTANDPTAVINLYNSANHKATKMGTGSASLRLAPGEYTVEASSGESAARAVGTVVSGQETNLVLAIQPLISVHAITHYSARDLFPTPDGLSFLNVPEKTVYHFAGKGEARAANRDAFPAEHVVWLSDGTYIYSTPDRFYYLVNGNSITKVNFVDATGSVVIPDSVKIISSGQTAFVVGKKLFYMPSITTAKSNLIKSDVNNAYGAPELELSSTGLLAGTYNPYDATVDAPKPVERTPAFVVDVSNGKAVSLGITDPVIDQARWSPDGKSLAFSNKNGTFVLNLASKEQAPVLTLAGSTSSSIGWVTSSSIIYVQGQDTWEYDTNSHMNSKLFHNPGSIDLVSPFVVSAGQVMFATGPAGTFGSVGSIYSAAIK